VSEHPTVVIGERCMHCCKFFSPASLQRFSGNVALCEQCVDNHRRALEVMIRASIDQPVQTPECAWCHATVNADAPHGDKRMYLVHEHGVMALICSMCLPAYEQQRRERLRGTPYGREKGLC
jgi:hypothetical protein